MGLSTKNELIKWKSRVNDTVFFGNSGENVLNFEKH